MLFWFLIHAFEHAFGADLDCLTPLSCQGSVILTGSGDDVNAFGYQSIYGSSTSINITAEAFCRGAESCSEVTVLSSENNMECDGAASCVNCPLLKVDDSAYCRGSNACSFSSIKAIDSDKELWCEGPFSCSHTYISNTDWIIAYGAFALYHSEIDSINSGSMFIDIRGGYTALGATIRCRNGDTMEVQ